MPLPTISAQASEKELCDRKRQSSYAHRTNNEGNNGSRDTHRKLRQGAEVKHNNQLETRIDGVVRCVWRLTGPTNSKLKLTNAAKHRSIANASNRRTHDGRIKL